MEKNMENNSTAIDEITENPIKLLTEFLKQQDEHEKNTRIRELRFIGYVLELGFDFAKIITSDPYKIAVGGIPRGAFVIMVPESFEGITPHFTLLRIKDIATTPLGNQIQQTYFELHKKSMPEIDIWTQSELQWGALNCDVLGMFYPDSENKTKLSFSGDVNNILSPHKYKVYSPDNTLLNLIVNALVRDENRMRIGNLRTMECELKSLEDENVDVPVEISMKDFMGCRTSMFGKTRLGKSNIVKLIMQGILDTSKDTNDVGQLVFDINGEYANDSEQHDITGKNKNKNNISIKTANKSRCIVYALVKNPNTDSKELKLNFYENPDICIGILASMLEQDGNTSTYIKNFSSVELPSIEYIASLTSEEEGEKTRLIRKIQMYWAILKKAGFQADENKLKKLGLRSNVASNFNPGLKKDLREEMGLTSDTPTDLESMMNEFEKLAEFLRSNKDSPLLNSSSSKRGKESKILDPDDESLLKFLLPLSSTSSGPGVLKSYKKYHSPKATDFIKEIIGELDQGKTIILDLGIANENIRKYFSDMISKNVFVHQEEKFVNNALGEHFIQLYFEEAHNLFPKNEKITGVYSRIAKEGAKFHIGMVYSTQSPSTINKELLTQTENFFVGHLSSKFETKTLSALQIAFEGIEDDILRSKTQGYMRMLTLSHRFIIPVQANLYDPREEGGI